MLSVSVVRFIPVHENGTFGVRKAEKDALVHENRIIGVREETGDGKEDRVSPFWGC